MQIVSLGEFLFSRKNKKKISLLSAEPAHSVIKMNRRMPAFTDHMCKGPFRYACHILILIQIIYLTLTQYGQIQQMTN